MHERFLSRLWLKSVDRRITSPESDESFMACMDGTESSGNMVPKLAFAFSALCCRSIEEEHEDTEEGPGALQAPEAEHRYSR